MGGPLAHPPEPHELRDDLLVRLPEKRAGAEAAALEGLGDAPERSRLLAGQPRAAKPGRRRREKLRGLGIPLELRGQFVPPNDFPCQWKVGRQSGYFVIPAYATRAVGDVVRPFESLQGLYVGQSWKLQLVNPLAGMLPGLSPQNLLGPEVLVRVTGTERILFGAKSFEAFVLEAPRLKAWVLPDGRVVRQRVELPVLGTIVLQQEPYNDRRRREVLGGLPSEPPGVVAPEPEPAP